MAKWQNMPHDRSMTTTVDLIVVGSGILGLATAFHAHQQGHRVLVVEAADRIVGSSIQNFGHACFTAQADSVQQVAAASRRGWLQAANVAGLWAAESGTWLPATTEIEMQVLEEFAAHRGSEQVHLAHRDQVAAALGNPELEAVGGAHLPLDMRVNPREAAPALARWLEAQGVEFRWNTRVTGAGDGVVDTTRGQLRAERVVLCPGYELMGLFPQIAEQYEVRVCELAMTLIDRPQRIPAELGMLTGTSMARYDGIAAMPSVGLLREELASREPGLVDIVANLMVTGLPSGLLIGDSHHYSLSPDPFIDAHVADLLLDRASTLLGIDRPVVRQRWQGKYADSAGTNLIQHHLDNRTQVVVVTSGIGMTMAFGIAEYVASGTNVPGFFS